ncbi:sodium-coupled monocarboxylate transporter 2-like [Vespa crabro]|uniref:sodium-coupled monocarboxylate transporter 2-like n=1 Tax=Vespa crabro TaxID=7445 RepID=UPI001F0244E7|nr:sodium-coupled monocarboxylate transporter 2-like [Vespa crabro]
MSLNDSSILNSEISDRFIFGWTDYVLFAMILTVSILIGIYFGFFSKQDTTMEYLLGGKRMGFFPIAMSLIASHISGITLLGVPSEVYQYGTQYAACIITSILSCFISAYVFLPVFFKLQLTSTFEYLEVRFSRRVRILCSLLFLISLLMYIPIVIYVPALAFSQVTDFSLHTITPVLCAVCILYTSIGGLKAVVWTDTIQFTVTIGGLFAVLILGIKSVGGVSEVWKRSEMGNRLIFFNMDVSPYARNTFWGMTIGMTTTWLVHLGIHQGCVQRYLSVPKERDAKRALGITAVGLIVVKLVSVFTGLIIFAKYYDCDPLLSKTIKRADQILPYYVMDVAGNVPGLPGLFLAGLVSAALATMSASLNTMSGTIYKDFIELWIPDGPKKEARAATIMKIIVLIIGGISVGLVFVVEHLGTVFQMAISIRSVTDGPWLGLFLLGMLFPCSNAEGALLGGFVSLIVMFFLAGGSEWYIANGQIHKILLPVSIEGCSYPLNETDITTRAPLTLNEEPMGIFKISFMYFTLIGSLIVVVVGVIGSYLFGNVDLTEIDPDHISPIMKRFLPRKEYTEVSLKSMPEEFEMSKDIDRQIIKKQNE